MLEEINIDPKIIQIIEDKEYSNTITTEKSDNWTLKIFLYCDLRTSPAGIISLKNRLTEVTNRLKKYRGRDDLFQAALRIENQIRENINVNLDQINIDGVKISNKTLLDVKM